MLVINMCYGGHSDCFWVFICLVIKNNTEVFPGGSVIKNPPANAGDRGSIPGPEIFHVPWGN